MTPRLIVAVGVGATKTLLTVRSVADLDSGWQLGEPVVRSSTNVDPVALIAWIGTEVERLQDRVPGRVVAVGVAAPGPLDAIAGVVTRSSNLGWRDVPLAPMLSERLRAPATLEDDANTAALGEWCFGAGRGADPLGYLMVSSGIGGGIVAGGEIVRGATGNAGEVGHLVVDPRGPRCSCGRRGDVESFAGGAALGRRALRAWPRSTTPAGRPTPRTAAEVFCAAREGDPVAVQIVADATEALATSLAAMAAVLEPEVIVVGGSIGLGQRRVVSRAATLARRRVLKENAAALRIVPAALGQESVLAGAADLGLKLVTSS